MKQATIIVEKASDGGYSAYVEEDFEGFGLAGYGDTANEAILDLKVAYSEIKQLRSEENLETPELEFVYKYDMQSFFNYFTFLNISRIGEIAGINPSLLRQYASGATHAGQKQYEKMQKAVNHIIRDLQLAHF